MFGHFYLFYWCNFWDTLHSVHRFYSHLGTGASEVSLVMVVFPKEEGLLMVLEQRLEELPLRSLVLLWHCQL